MQEIAAAVREGAQAYLNRQYTTIAIVGVVIFVVAGLFPRQEGRRRLRDRRGAVGRGRLYRHERFGARQRAHRAGGQASRWPRGLDLAFKAGAITGLLVAGLGLLGVAGLFRRPDRRAGFAADSRDRRRCAGRARLRRLADLDLRPSRRRHLHQGRRRRRRSVGKVEAGIPEDDPRNPATIADNVGDNVGDCAGMAADLFETYAVTTVATMVLAAIFFAGDLDPDAT